MCADDADDDDDGGSGGAAAGGELHMETDCEEEDCVESACGELRGDVDSVMMANALAALPVPVGSTSAETFATVL